MEQPLLKTTGLKKYFKTPSGDLHAVDDINISINKGETLGVVGESGCGKTTLGRTLIMLTKPTAGDIFFQGENITKMNKRQLEQRRRDMQIIFQDPYSSLNPRMTVQDLIAEPMLINKVCSKNQVPDKVRKLMDTVGIAQRLQTAYPHELDGGRRQRIGIARALSLNPKFIVCDEPVSALDVSIQAQILNLLMDLQEEFQLTYLFITHDLSVVRHISTHIAVMYLGRCIEKAPAKRLFENPIHPYTKALLAAIPKPVLMDTDQSIEVMRGEITSPINPPASCRFAPRCDFCKEECKHAEPILKEIEPEHFVACFKAE